MLPLIEDGEWWLGILSRYENNAYPLLEELVGRREPVTTRCVLHLRIASPTDTKAKYLMSEKFPLPTNPEDVIPSLVERFDSGDVMNQMEMYAPDAVFVANDGRLVTDRAEIAAIIGRDIKLGLQLNTNVRHVFATGDTAQIVLDWSIDGKGPDGKDVHLHGTASDIVRRGTDGFWRYIIDNNQGTAVRHAV